MNPDPDVLACIAAAVVVAVDVSLGKIIPSRLGFLIDKSKSFLSSACIDYYVLYCSGFIDVL
jgi:hypothetical protein